MEQFSLEKHLENPSRKVVTRDGRKVNILKYDAITPMYPVIVSIIREDGAEIPTTYTKEGHDNVECLMHNEKNDLFFADEEEELTEFEKELKAMIEDVQNGDYIEEESFDFWKNRLLDLARKELQPEFEKELDKAYKTQDDVVYRNGYAQGKQDALKVALESLPKWKKVTKTKNFDNHILIFEDEERVALTTVIYEGEYYIELDDLKTLPKEE